MHATVSRTEHSPQATALHSPYAVNSSKLAIATGVLLAGSVCTCGWPCVHKHATVVAWAGNDSGRSYLYVKRTTMCASALVQALGQAGEVFVVWLWQLDLILQARYYYDKKTQESKVKLCRSKVANLTSWLTSYAAEPGVFKRLLHCFKFWSVLFPGSECVALTTHRLPWPRVVNILVIDWLPRNYGDVNKPLPRAAPSGIGWFTAIIPCPPVYNYNVPALYHDLVELLRQSRRGRETVAFVDYSYDLMKTITQSIIAN